ncbi:ABC transporter permease [Patulibacter sp. NPDC049589]|uniref:ABC transporter permease n=1 Tax=Patulibacter sp. NPDC049589 TaxID=3154731 RepID=UPI0034374E12
MSLSRVWTILRKDLLDAIRDGRILAIIIVPLALGILYSVIYPDEEPRPKADVVVVGGPTNTDAKRLSVALPRDVGRALNLTVTTEPDEAKARDTVADDDADVAVVVPEGLVARARAGRAPPLRVLVGPDASPSARAVVDLLPATVGKLADRAPAVQVAVRDVQPKSPSVVDELGLRDYFVLAAVVMTVGFIGLLATPIVLAEEIEKRTIEALLLAARGPEVLAAKALVGIVYSAAATAILLALTGVPIERPGLFVLGALGMVVSIVGFGLCLAYVFRSADKLNTWGWVIVMPAIVPGFAVGVDPPGWASAIFQATPTGQGMRLMVDGALPTDVFGGVGLAIVVFAVWGAGGLVLLSRLLQRRGS